MRLKILIVIAVVLSIVNVTMYLLAEKYYADARETLERITREVEEFDRNNTPMEVAPDEWRG